jgi:solute carrier family 25 oxoglutarate transporter 11
MADANRPPMGLRFLFGTVSVCTATVCTHPFDVVKVRMQLSGEGGAVAAAAYKNSFSAAVSIARTEGLTGIYAGLTASLLRQCSYGTARLGIYSTLFDYYVAANGGTPPPFVLKAAIGSVAGGIGSIIGTPFDLALVRMAADSKLPIAERRNYRNGLHAVLTIARQEGVPALWRGCLPTVSRCIVLNISQLATYSEAKERILHAGVSDGLVCHVGAALVSGLASTTASVPLDTAKTRIQQATARGAYSGLIDCLAKTVRQEGVLSLWKGWLPAYARLGPHVLVTFVMLEQLNTKWKEYKQGA